MASGEIKSVRYTSHYNERDFFGLLVVQHVYFQAAYVTGVFVPHCKDLSEIPAIECNVLRALYTILSFYEHRTPSILECHYSCGVIDACNQLSTSILLIGFLFRS